jgi:PAP2 superfamily
MHLHSSPQPFSTFDQPLNAGTTGDCFVDIQTHHIIYWQPFWMLSFVTLLASVALLANAGKFDPFDYIESSGTLIAVLGLAISFILMFQAVRIIITERPKSPITVLSIRLGSFIRTPSNWLIPVINFLALANLLQSYTVLKKIMTTLKPFTWDEKLLMADKWLHFGVDPWRITHTIFGSDFMTYAINLNYHGWFPVVFGFLAWGILGRKHEKLRAQFLLSAMALWIISGNLVAIYFSSAGPCFFEHLDFANGQYYQPLMQKLVHSHTTLLAQGWYRGLPAIPLQQTLWADYVSSGDMFGGGVSAFPSMHVAMAVTVALAASRLHRWIGALAWLFAFFIQIGSVHLGWHYAVDGYASTLLAILFWKVSGKILKSTAPL